MYRPSRQVRAAQSRSRPAATGSRRSRPKKKQNTEKLGGSLTAYQKVKAIGKGQYGTVYLVRRKADGEQFAMKQLNVSVLSKDERDAAMQEIEFLKHIHHPYVIKFEEAFLGVGGTMLFIIAEYAEKGDLYTAIQKRRGQHFSEDQIVTWFGQLCLALKHLHDKRIIHRDIKSLNVFIAKDNSLRLGDFGIARVLEGTLEMARTKISTPIYTSPEIIEDKPYAYKSDVWALGCVLQEMAALRPPFMAQDMPTLFDRILKGSPARLPSIYSSDLQALVMQMLRKRPEDRPSISKIVNMDLLRPKLRQLVQSGAFAKLSPPRHNPFVAKLLKESGRGSRARSSASQRRGGGGGGGAAAAAARHNHPHHHHAHEYDDYAYASADHAAGYNQPSRRNEIPAVRPKPVGPAWHDPEPEEYYSDDNEQFAASGGDGPLSPARGGVQNYGADEGYGQGQQGHGGSPQRHHALPPLRLGDANDPEPSPSPAKSKPSRSRPPRHQGGGGGGGGSGMGKESIYTLAHEQANIQYPPKRSQAQRPGHRPPSIAAQYDRNGGGNILIGGGGGRDPFDRNPRARQPQRQQPIQQQQQQQQYGKPHYANAAEAAQAYLQQAPPSNHSRLAPIQASERAPPESLREPDSDPRANMYFQGRDPDARVMAGHRAHRDPLSVVRDQPAGVSSPALSRARSVAPWERADPLRNREAQQHRAAPVREQAYEHTHAHEQRNAGLRARQQAREQYHQQQQQQQYQQQQQQPRYQQQQQGGYGRAHGGQQMPASSVRESVYGDHQRNAGGFAQDQRRIPPIAHGGQQQQYQQPQQQQAAITPQQQLEGYRRELQDATRQQFWEQRDIAARNRQQAAGSLVFW